MRVGSHRFLMTMQRPYDPPIRSAKHAIYKVDDSATASSSLRLIIIAIHDECSRADFTTLSEHSKPSRDNAFYFGEM